MNVPEIPPTLLPGRSAWGWMRIGVVCLLGELPLLVPIVVGAAVAQPLRDIVMSGAFLAIVGIGAVGIRAFVRFNSVTLEERDAGYTTLYGMFRHLWQLDHRTGEVLRRPGERRARRPGSGGS